jgi:hypothetical protein
MRTSLSFWICTVLVVVNTGLIFFAPTPEMLGGALGRAVFCAFVAVFMFLRASEGK